VFERWTFSILAVTTVGAGIGLRVAALDPILLVAMIGALLARTHNRPLTAGLLLAIGLAKPQTIWLIPVALLVTREWRMLAGLAMGAGAWLIASVVAAGPHSIVAWIDSTRLSVSEGSLGIPGVVGRITGSSSYWIWVTLACGLAALIAAWLLRDRLRSNWEITFCLSLAASLATSPHLWEYEMLLVALPVCCWARHRVVGPVVTVLLMSALFTVNRSAGWEDYLLWVPPAIIAIGLARELRPGRGPEVPQQRFASPAGADPL
jgi:hypothetical protein